MVRPSYQEVFAAWEHVTFGDVFDWRLAAFFETVRTRGSVSPEDIAGDPNPNSKGQTDGTSLYNGGPVDHGQQLLSIMLVAVEPLAFRQGRWVSCEQLRNFCHPDCDECSWAADLELYVIRRPDRGKRIRFRIIDTDDVGSRWRWDFEVEGDALALAWDVEWSTSEDSGRFDEEEIEDLDFTIRTHNLLKRAGVKTVGQLREKTDADLLDIRRFSQENIDEVDAKLAERGLRRGE